MKNKLLQIIMLVIFSIISAKLVTAQVTFSFTQPPVDHLYNESLWNVIITNSSAEPIDVYLYGTVSEEDEGLIAEGSTTVFTLDAFYAGPVYSFDLSPVDVEYPGGKNYEEMIALTGEFPTGNYTICVSVMAAVSDKELYRQCLDHQVFLSTAPYLISPSDGSTVSEPNPVFIWSSPSPGRLDEITFEIRLVERYDGQGLLEAIESNPAFFNEEDILTTAFQFPISAREFEPGKEYAWQVTARLKNERIGESEVWGFIYQPVNQCDCGDLTEFNVNVQLNANQQDQWGFHGTYSYNNITPITPTIHFPGFFCTGSCPPGYPVYNWQITAPTGCTGASGSGQTISNYTFNCYGKYIIRCVIMCGNNECFVIRDTLNFVSDCCFDFITDMEKQELSFDAATGLVGLNNLLTTVPPMIQEVNVTLVSASSEVTYPCANPGTAVAGYISSVASSFGTFNIGYPGTASWIGGPVNMAGQIMNLKLALDAGPCNAIAMSKNDNVSFCLHYFFTDEDCMTCDTTICYTLPRSVSMTQVMDQQIATPVSGFQQLNFDKDVEVKEEMEKPASEEIK